MPDNVGTPTEAMRNLVRMAESGQISKRAFVMAFQQMGGFDNPMLFEKPAPPDTFDWNQAQQGIDAYQALGKFPEYMKTDPSYAAERKELQSLNPEQRDKLLNPPKPPTEFESAYQQTLGRMTGLEGGRKALKANMSMTDMRNRAPQFFGKIPEEQKLGALQGVEQALKPPSLPDLISGSPYGKYAWVNGQLQMVLPGERGAGYQGGGGGGGAPKATKISDDDAWAQYLSLDETTKAKINALLPLDPFTEKPDMKMVPDAMRSAMLYGLTESAVDPQSFSQQTIEPGSVEAHGKFWSLMWELINAGEMFETLQSEIDSTQWLSPEQKMQATLDLKYLVDTGFIKTSDQVLAGSNLPPNLTSISPNY